MLLATLRSLFARELRALQREVEAYPDDLTLWRVIPGTSNSAGTLVLHLAGNLRYLVGAVLGGDGFVRDRAAEFSRRGLSGVQLLAEIDATAQAVDAALAAMTVERLEADYPVPVAERVFCTQDFLLHLVSHLAYHLGQIDYHRRTSTGEAGSVGAVSLEELPRRD